MKSGSSIFKLAIFLFIAASFWIKNVNAQIKFRASAPASVSENQNFNLTYTVENGNGTNLEPPPMNDFTVLGGPNTSSSVQIINGNMTQSVSYSYILRPKRQGTFKIGKATIEVNGNTVESNELTIQVSAPSSNSQSQQNQSSGGNNATSDADLEKQLKEDVFVKVFLSKGTVYKGEMLSATYKLYFRQNLNGFNLSKAPALDGFWSKEVELDPNRKQKVETVNGKEYYTINILQFNLYPQRSGTLQVSPAEISTVAQVVVRSKSRDPFGDFFNDPFGDYFGMGQRKNVPLTLTTGVATVTVKDLPEAGKPKDFAGAVGKFNFETSLSNKEVKTDDALTYTIKIGGEGNLNLIEPPPLQLLPSFEVYDPKVKEQIANSASGISGSKQYDYLIIPRQPGEYKLSGQSFSYFDPSVEKYVSITSPEYPLKVTGAPAQTISTNAGSGVNQQEIALLGDDIRYIKMPLLIFDKSDRSFFGSAPFIAAYSIPFFAFIGIIALRRRKENLAADITGSKRRRAMKLAKKRLQHADKLLAHNEKKNFYDEVSRATWGYLGDKLNIDLADLSKDTVSEKLSAKNVKSETISRLHELLNSCEISLYAPSGNHAELKNDYETAVNLIADLEDEIRN